MLLLTLATRWVLAAEPVVTEEVTPTRAVAVELPEGVELLPTARELAKGKKPPQVQFEVVGKPTIEGNRLIVKGVLVNEGSKQVQVFLESDKHRKGPFLLHPKDVSYKKDAPEGRVSPMEVSLPPGGQVVFRSALVLDEWDWPASGAAVHWSFHFWGSEETGTLPGLLSPP